MSRYHLSDLIEMSPTVRVWAVHQASIQSEAIYGEPWRRYGRQERPIGAGGPMPNLHPFPSPRPLTNAEREHADRVQAFIAIRKRRKVSKKGRYLEQLRLRLAA